MCEPGSVLIPGNNDLIVVRVTDQFSIIDGLSWENPLQKSGCWAYAVAPANLLDATTRILTNHNKLLNYNIQGYDEGIVYQVGPTVRQEASNCYYNMCADGQINNTKRGMWFKDGLAGSQGANRNWIVRPRIGNGVNTGIQIDAADTIVIDSPVFEGISKAAGGGMAPNVVCTALKIATGGTVSGWECYEIKVSNAIAEACDRDLDCGNDDTSFTNCTFDFAHKAVFRQTPQFYAGRGYNPGGLYTSANNGRGFAGTTLGRMGLFGDKIGPASAPEVTLDAREDGPGAVAIIRAKSTAKNGVAEVRIDTGSTSGYYSFFHSGSQQWSVGARGGAVDTPTFFNQVNAATFSISAQGDSVRIYNSKTPSAGNDKGSRGSVCWDSHHLYVCVETNRWKRVALEDW